MLPEFSRQVQPLDLRHRASTAESHPRQFLTQSFRFDRIGGLLESVSQFQERYSSLFVRFDRVSKKINERAIDADTALTGDLIDLDSDFAGKRNAASNDFLSR
jgi:hypothetical protein